MAKKTVSFRIEESNIALLDDLAKESKRDRTQLIGEAIDNYLWLQARHREEIQEGLRAAEAGEFATDEEVEAAFASWLPE